MGKRRKIDELPYNLEGLGYEQVKLDEFLTFCDLMEANNLFYSLLRLLWSIWTKILGSKDFTTDVWD